ncbi:MAG: two-component system, OmpR family, sensor histidine kinase BaeS [Solirubrobacteraceae bacterium]|nr:two-component system, OmpR family, sensor histidine kinase BaeS [Solirubrobacteraceae bacterium]
MAMVAIALTSVAVTGLLFARAVDSELTDFSARDLRFSAANAAEMAAAVYLEAGGWSERSVRALRTVAHARGDEVAFLGPHERPVPGSPAPAAPGGVRAAVLVGGVRVCTVIAMRAHHGSVDGAVRRLDRRLRSQVDDVLLQAGVLAGLVALLVALAVALRMARPLHRLTEVARRMEAGEIEARATGSGGSREMAGLARTMDRLAAALRRQDELRRATAADVTHELRSALVGVFARVELLQDALGRDQQAVLAQMAGDARRLHRLVDDVDRLAEAQGPGLLMHRRPIALDAIVRARVDACGDLSRARSIALSRRVAPAWVRGDPDRLSQVLENLLANALRYTDPGGRVCVRLDVRGREAAIEVADSGIGIAPEHLGRIFDRFWRAPAAHERTAEGSGVGLALVSELVLAHGGRVEVSSRPGRGSCFTVLLPLADAPSARGPAAVTARPAIRRLRDELERVGA